MRNRERFSERTAWDSPLDRALDAAALTESSSLLGEIRLEHQRELLASVAAEAGGGVGSSDGWADCCLLD